MGRKRKTNKERIKNRSGVTDPELLDEMDKVMQYYLLKGYYINKLLDGIFPSFLAGGIKGDMLERCLKIRELGYSNTLEKQVLKWGEKIGTERWEEYRAKQAETNTFKYKQEKYGMTKDEFDEFNASRSVTLDNCIGRHGEEKGTEIFENYREKQRTHGCSLEWFQGKLGIEEGKLFFENLSIQKSHSLESYIMKHGKKKGTEIYHEYKLNFKTPGKISKSSEMLFKVLDENYGTNKVYHETLNKEFGKYDKKYKRYYYYDYTFTDKKIIIEFNGDIWHGNPELYTTENWKHPFGVDITLEEIWEYDKRKKEVAEEAGYTVIYVWEKVFLKDKNVIIQELKEKINANEYKGTRV